MNIMLKFRLFKHDWAVRIGQQVRVLGINSTLESGEHCLMWEFDNKDIATVRRSLGEVQGEYGLPTITLCQSSNDSSWHAYCFVALPWPHAIAYVASTQNIDWEWFKMCINRSHFTLRVSDKGSGVPEFKEKLTSWENPDVTYEDLASGVSYMAWRRSAQHVR